jgi:cytochrome b561
MTDRRPDYKKKIFYGVEYIAPFPVSALPDMPTYRVAHAIHVVSAILLAALIVLHVAGALVHAALWRDRTLVQMWWKRRPVA